MELSLTLRFLLTGSSLLVEHWGIPKKQLACRNLQKEVQLRLCKNFSGVPRNSSDAPPPLESCQIPSNVLFFVRPNIGEFQKKQRACRNLQKEERLRLLHELLWSDSK
ncbi:hypothetical protein CEXT_272821 [Caerostris extrusa]|uniref:Uncharacterized protein n=1 Tax=Caerostris extrusa TaxID=172846 RepID=A0AAV4MAP4_CAEEX|nr:hypothetical protein CEXT_272821 [Caerostris extrusa]